MFTPTSDYTQQLFAYLQAWRQLLEQWTGMAAALPFPTVPFMPPTAPFMPAGGQFMPFMPPAMPFMPPAVPFMPPPPAAPVAPTPPAPADYTQQLFGYLAAWRHYLEQMAGATPGSPPAPAQAATAESADSGKTQQGGTPVVPTPPGDELGSKGGPGDTTGDDSNLRRPPHLVLREPSDYGGNQVISIGGLDEGLSTPFDRGPEAPRVLNPPEYNFGYESPRGRTGATGPAVRVTPEAVTHLPITGTPFRSAIERVEPTASPQVVPRSLFSSSGAQAASARISELGETPTP